MKKLLVVDGNSILNRAFFGVRPLTTSDGKHTNALFGTVNMIARQLEAISPDYTAVAFDIHAPTFRHKLYDAYKAGRHPTPPELLEQFPTAKRLFADMGFQVLEQEGYEADDILGTLAQMAEKNGVEAYVMTGDRDSLQLISDHTRVLLATNADTVLYDRDAFFARYGIQPEQFVDVKALMGDSSDNIPGVPGIGEKTALKLIAEKQNLDGVYADLSSLPVGPAAKAKLEAGKESAYLSQKLAQICREVPLTQSLEDLKNPGLCKPALLSLFTELEFSSFIKRFDLAKAAESPSRFVNKTEAVPADAVLLLDTLSVRSFSFFPHDKALHFFDGQTLYAYDQDPRAIRALFEDRGQYHTICHDSKSAAHWLYAKGISYTTCVYDTMLACYILSPGESTYNLDKCLLAYCREQLDECDADAVYRLYQETEKSIQKNGEESLLHEIEEPLAQVLSEMEETGFGVDVDGLNHFADELTQTENILCERIYAEAGCPFNINSPKQLGDVLFNRLGLPAGKKTKSGYSTGAEILEHLCLYHPIASDILEYRQVTKLKNTYAIGLAKLAGKDGRIRSTFNQTGTATGRLSSSEPNLQNIPIRTELGRKMRRYFTAREGCVLVDADYSQIELRLLAHISGDPVMTRAFLSGEDIHTSTASTVFGIPPEYVTPELRKRAKAVNFGIVYGIGDFSLASDLHISRKQADQYIQNYLEKFAGVSAYLKECVAQARENGYTTTIFGRRRYIPELKAQNKNLQKFGERVAMNSPIQGSAADIIKIAMIRVSHRLKKENLDAKLILQVHDELILEAAESCVEQAKTLLREEMENAVKLHVPLPVEVSTGRTWYDAK